MTIVTSKLSVKAVRRIIYLVNQTYGISVVAERKYDTAVFTITSPPDHDAFLMVHAFILGYSNSILDSAKGEI